MAVDELRINLKTQQRAVCLRGAPEVKRLGIWIGTPEADHIHYALVSQPSPRPFWLQAGAAMIETAGGRLVELRITRAEVDTSADPPVEVYYAEVVVDGPLGRAAVDARPSDALALAVAIGTPIRAARPVVDGFGWPRG